MLLGELWRQCFIVFWCADEMSYASSDPDLLRVVVFLFCFYSLWNFQNLLFVSSVLKIFSDVLGESLSFIGDVGPSHLELNILQFWDIFLNYFLDNFFSSVFFFFFSSFNLALALSEYLLFVLSCSSAFYFLIFLFFRSFFSSTFSPIEIFYFCKDFTF